MNPFLQASCLICFEIIRPIVGWRAIFSEEKEQLICPICKEKLEMIDGERCRVCSRSFKRLDEKFRSGDICHDCFRWEQDLEWRGYLDVNHSIFLYNDFLKEVLARFKFRGDYVLANIFAEPIKEELQKMNPDLVVPIPLSEERLYERGFNQAEALLLNSGYLPSNLLTRIHSEKQSKKSRSERIHIPQVFQLDDQSNVSGKNVLLIDDIYTTGSTLRHAAKLFKNAGAKRTQSLTIAR